MTQGQLFVQDSKLATQPPLPAKGRSLGMAILAHVVYLACGALLAAGVVATIAVGVWLGMWLVTNAPL